ncbi:MAG: (d)CMP kinase [Treponemataceae bacterium]
MNYTFLKPTVRIAISGKSGCGNTSVTKKLSEILCIPMINFTFRNLTEKYKMTLAQIIEDARFNDEYDLAVDKHQVELAQKEPYCVLGSRLAIWMLKDADIKIYLDASVQVRAQRIFQREGGNFQKNYDFTLLRDNEDTNRYQKLYNIDNTKYDFADLCIDTAKYSVEQIVSIILNKLEEIKLISNDTK